MKNILIPAGVAVLAVVLGFVFVPRVVNPEPPFGAQSVNLLEGNCLTVEGVQRCFTKKAINNASTTLCSIKSPAATSTLIRGGLTVASTSATITYLEWFKTKNSSGGATTTIINSTQWAAGAQVSTTTGQIPNTALNADTIFAPNEYLGIRVVNAAFAQLGGTCQAVFETLK